MKDNPFGLTPTQVEENRARHGRNVLEPPPHKSVWKLAAEKFCEPLILILTLAALISMLTGGFVEGTGILIAVLLSAGIGFFSEYRAGRAFDILNRTDDEVPFKVCRNGVLISCPRAEIVTGDIVRVEAGEEIPADARVLESSEFQVDQSKFTGEPEPVSKVEAENPSFGELAEGASYPPDRVLRGSTVLSGNACLEVTAVGMATEIGQTARAATEITDETTPLQKQLQRLSKIIAVAGISLSTVFFGLLLIQAWYGGNWNLETVLAAFMVAVTLIVVTVPEGLPMSVTLSLACSMRKMSQYNCLIRRLHAGETIGCATVICTDKTGTLTMNRMRLAQTFFPKGCETLMAEAFCLNSTAELNGEEVLGNPTEGALLHYLSENGVDYRKLRASNTVAARRNFTTMTKYMATQLESGQCHLKGAPEVILAKCRFRQTTGSVEELTPAIRAGLLEAFRNEQDKGRRTLAFAYSAVPCDPDSTNDLVYLGFAAISDPVRLDVPDAVRVCRRAGINVKIVTGDTAATASEIGHEIGLADGTVMEGAAFESLDREKTAELLDSLAVIARARPNDKLKLVKALQARGEVVAVTGDGTNDAPALHHADVGIAMGRTGTAIAREAADVILLDDSFRSIVHAVLWGRSLYLNIQRFLVFQLTINAAAAGIALAGPFVGISLPFTVIQMLWINLIMDTFAALALATEPPTPEVMEQPPRKTGTFIITRPMAWTIFGTALIFIAMFFVLSCVWRNGGLSARELTVLFSSFVMLQVWNLLNVRALGSNKSMILNPPLNPVFSWVAAGIVGMQVLITQFGGKLFRTVPLGLADWLIIIGATSSIFWAGEIYRWRRRKSENRHKGN